MKKILVILSLLLAVNAEAEVLSSYLPQKLSDKNVKISFEVDSTWHLVEGKTSGIGGQVALTDSGNVNAEILIPVAKFDTDSGMRDKKMKKVMHQTKHPNVSFKVFNILNICKDDILASKKCDVEVDGELEISGNKKKIKFPAKIFVEKSMLNLEGKTSLLWADYGVEDPSILVAKLNEKVSINFNVKLDKLENK